MVNLGDMLQVWSNDRYVAPEHRVVPNAERERWSAPYFFNPAYRTVCEPLPELVAAGDAAHYRGVHWGEFRRARADGDYTDLGEEIQITRFRVVPAPASPGQ